VRVPVRSWVDGLLARAWEQGLRAVFAITVSDLGRGVSSPARGSWKCPTTPSPPPSGPNYDAARMSDARAFLRETTSPDDQGSFSF